MMSETTKTPTRTPRPTKLLEVYLDADDNVGVSVNAVALIQCSGPDPANWAGVLSALIHTLVMDHCEALVMPGTGEHPTPEKVYARLLSELSERLKDTSGDKPLYSMSLEEFLS
jgi:hypothetical protein